jgi:ligand-binding SRPBCC domain-containing protein
MIFAAPLQCLTRQQHLPLSPDEAWDFFSRPDNLAKITPGDLGFEITSPLRDKMYAGMIVSYRVRPLAGIAVPWVTEITHVREPLFFVDEQRSGPYRFWHHQHLFEPVGSGVRMTDLVHYQLPLGLVGQLLLGPIVTRRLEGIFAYRERVLTTLFP